MYWRRKRWNVWILSPAVIDMFHSAISCSSCRGWGLPLSPSHFWQGQRKPSDSSPLQLISPLVNCHFYSKLEEKSHSSWKTKVSFTRWSSPPSHSTAETPVQNCLPVAETQAGDILPLPALPSVSQLFWVPSSLFYSPNIHCFSGYTAALSDNSPPFLLQNTPGHMQF